MGSTSRPAGSRFVHTQLPDPILRAFVDGDRDLDAFTVRGQHHARRRDLHREEAPVVVRRVDHQDVALERILTEWPARTEREESTLPGEHDVAQFGVGDVLVADEADASDADLLVLFDGELDDDFVVALRDDLEGRFGEEVALLGVEVADLLRGAAKGRVAQDGVGLDLDAFVQLLVFDLVVARVLDQADVRALAHDEPKQDAAVGALEIDLNVVEEAGVPQFANVARERLGAEGMPDTFSKIGEKVVASDPPRADQIDAEQRLTSRKIRLARRQLDRARHGLFRRRRAEAAASRRAIGGSTRSVRGSAGWGSGASGPRCC